MRPLSQTLTDLIACSSTIIDRPGTPVVAGVPQAFTNLAAEIRHADSLPAENVRTTRAAMVMVIALEAFIAGDRDAGSPWLMLAGATLPLLRGDAWRQLTNEKEANQQGRDR